MQAFDIKSPMGYDNLLCNGNQTAAVICLTEKASRLASYKLAGTCQDRQTKRRVATSLFGFATRPWGYMPLLCAVCA